MHVIMPSFGGRPLFYIKCHAQYSCSIPRTIRAVLLLRNASFRTCVCFRRTMLFLERLYLLSVVDNLVALTLWNQVFQRRDEFVPA